MSSPSGFVVLANGCYKRQSSRASARDYVLSINALLHITMSTIYSNVYLTLRCCARAYYQLIYSTLSQLPRCWLLLPCLPLHLRLCPQLPTHAIVSLAMSSRPCSSLLHLRSLQPIHIINLMYVLQLICRYLLSGLVFSSTSNSYTPVATSTRWLST